MHTPSTHSSSPQASTQASRRSMQGAQVKTESGPDHENVQRFRILMDSKRAVPADTSEASVSDEDTSVDEGVDASAPSSEEQALRELLQRQLSDSEGRSLSVPARDQDDDGGSGQQDDNRGYGQNLANLGMQIVHQEQLVMQQNIEQPPASQAAMAPALAELIERHVKQLLVPDATSRSSAQSREIMITLKDGLLPGTELWLSRTSTGWKLRADTRSSTTYRSLVEGAPQLIERFALSNLGSLEITPTLLA